MTCRVTNLREYLVGAWKIDRAITDRRRHMDGALQGRAVFTPDDHDLVLAETGHLRFGTFAGLARRDYRYVFHTDERADIQFPDGHHFCSVSLDNGQCRVEHLCGSDHYRGTYVASTSDFLCIQWAVRGPAKDLLIKTCYRRA